MRSSYPFLTLARRFHVNYGAVLGYADVAQRKIADGSMDTFTLLEKRARDRLGPRCRLAVTMLCWVPISERHLVDLDDILDWVKSAS